MKTNIISKMTSTAIRAAFFVALLAIGFVSGNTTVYAQWGYTDYSGSDWGYTDYGSTNWGYSDYSGSDWGYTDYGSSDWGYTDYSYGDWGYTDYGYNDYSYGDWGYTDYNYGDWGYTDYNYGDWGYTDYSYSDWGYTDYNYGDWGYTDYNYGDWGYTDYGYTDYSYTDYLVPDYGYSYASSPSYGCSGSSCGGSNYYRPQTSSRGCSGSSCGGTSRGSGLNLGLNYSDDDTTVTNTTRVNNRIDNSVRIHEDNDTTTTTNTCSNGDGNCNTTTNTHIVYGDGGNNNNNDDLDVQCRVSDTSIDEGDTVTFTVDIDGGDSPYDIEWDGDISGDDRTERVRFNRAGRYEVEVTVRDDDGNRASDTCATVRVGDDDDNNNVNVITRTNLGTPTGNLASLDSVFLSQVPYTGPEDVLKALGVLAFIAIWSTGVAIYFKRRRAARTTSAKLAAFKEMNKAASSIR